MSESQYHAPAAESVLAILEYLAGSVGSRGPTEISRQTGIGMNLAFRVLKVLSDRGYVTRNDAGRYELGSKLFTLGMKLASRFELRKIALPGLRQLAEESGETTQMQIPDGDRMLQVACEHPPRDYFLAVQPGMRLYYHGNAFGKAVMAFLDKEELQAILHRKLPQLTAATVCAPEAIRSELEAIRRTGIATEFSEYLEGVYCIGAPVFDASGKVAAAVGISGLVSRLKPSDKEHLSALVRQCAEDITKTFGGETPHAGNRV